MEKPEVAAESCRAIGGSERPIEVFETRELSLGSVAITRALPVKGRRLVGPWCFLDRFGPLSFTDAVPMDVAPHPHIGLQTVTWLLDGEVAHSDSLGSEAVARPGGVNVMTSGAGIAHAERTPSRNSGRLDGVQLWVALPDAHRGVAPSFQHVPEAPIVEREGGVVRVFAGGMEAAVSPSRHYSDLVGADIQVYGGKRIGLPADAGFEHAVLLLDGDVSLDGQPLQPRLLYYLGARRKGMTLSSAVGGRVLLLGGPPFPETILMWWNFVARTPEEIRDAREDWVARRRFGEVTGYPAPRLEAPELMRLAHPNPMS